MFNRRNLRIKVMQALYAFFRSENPDLKKSEKELLLSIEKVHDLYVYLFLLLTETANFTARYIEQSKERHLPTNEDMDQHRKFINNRFIKALNENKDFKRFIKSKKLSWSVSGGSGLVKKVFLHIKSSPEYALYITSPDDSYKADVEFIHTMFKNHIACFPPLRQFLEQENIFWAVDLDLVNYMICRTIKFSGSFSKDTPLLCQYIDDAEDREFVLNLFRKTILHEKKYEKLIGKKAKNWETDRIAMMDILLMKMAMCEILEFPTVPVKVSLDEYIEIAKQYSTPRSNIFINGILDKLAADFRKGKKIKKTGRGLVN